MRFRAAAAVAIAGACLFALTLLVPDWIEAVVGVEPDRRSGSLEWAIAIVPLAVAVAAGAVAGLEWLRLRMRTSAERVSPSSEPR